MPAVHLEWLLDTGDSDQYNYSSSQIMVLDINAYHRSFSEISEEITTLHTTADEKRHDPFTIRTDKDFIFKDCSSKMTSAQIFAL